MPSGGPRTGTPGKAYTNRADLRAGPQAVKAAPGQAYGLAQQQRDAQHVVPLTNTTALPTQTTPAGAAPAPIVLPVQPGSLGFTDPSRRPDEPVTAGLPIGAGPGPEAIPSLGAQQQYSNARVFLTTALAGASGNAEVAHLLAQVQARGL